MARKKVTTPTEVNEDFQEELEIEEQQIPTEELEEAQLSNDWGPIIRIYDEWVIENQKDVCMICDSVNFVLYSRFAMQMDEFKRPVRNGYKMTCLIFCYTYAAIINELQKLREEYSSYQINLANRLLIGYTNQSSEEDEKTGNFMIFIKHLNHYSVGIDDGEYKTPEEKRRYVTEWNSENMTEKPDVTARIAAYAHKQLEKINIILGSPEFIFPVFITVYEGIVNYVKNVRRKETLEEYEINFASCFWIKAMEQDDGVDKIVIRPSIESKLDLKSDKDATSIYD